MPGAGALAMPPEPMPTMGAGDREPVSDTELHATRLPTMKPERTSRTAPSTRQIGNGQKLMWLIVLEAAGALAVLVFVVWWTMFSGRRGGELRAMHEAADRAADRVAQAAEAADGNAPSGQGPRSTP